MASGILMCCLVCTSQNTTGADPIPALNVGNRVGFAIFPRANLKRTCEQAAGHRHDAYRYTHRAVNRILFGG